MFLYSPWGERYQCWLVFFQTGWNHQFQCSIFVDFRRFIRNLEVGERLIRGSALAQHRRLDIEFTVHIRFFWNIYIYIVCHVLHILITLAWYSFHPHPTGRSRKIWGIVVVCLRTPQLAFPWSFQGVGPIDPLRWPRRSFGSLKEMKSWAWASGWCYDD